MSLKILNPRQELRKTFLKSSINKNDYEKFKKNLIKLFKGINVDEREENYKILLINFLNDTYYKDKHRVNTYKNIDLVISINEKIESKPGVLCEVKRPKNDLEMISRANLNAKAMHELILYYLQERIENKNDDIRHLIATNIYEWFVFDASLFETLIYKNKVLVTKYEQWRNKQKVAVDTDFFYKEIAFPFLNEIKEDITFTYFDLRDCIRLFNEETEDTQKTTSAIFKILSPVHLLKQPLINDSNILDRGFYNELLHLIGLFETKENNKKIIKRKPPSERDPGSLIENIINMLIFEDKLSLIENSNLYGTTDDEKLFNLGLELSITWLNRILFLKLLEAQLFRYHNDNKYKFLNIDFIGDFGEIYKLFHSVLAVPIIERNATIKTKFEFVPYLNSSLFEISELEEKTIRINQLDSSTKITISLETVLLAKTGKREKGTIRFLEYFFRFLDSYDFTSEGKEEIKEDKKTLINAAVLGLIFEKINGYKEGSYYTPSFITMYMCKETLRKAVVKKFNERFCWDCETIDDTLNHISAKRNTNNILEYNAVINSLKICDPAVGSGHFLVSALNELIFLKSYFGILSDENGRVLNSCNAHIENDELIISYNNGEDIFEYRPPINEREININNLQLVQETLFKEKLSIIENCLFGVDINPNSVKIARLRLWIELLKNSYYTHNSGYTELETLPNIDINIKEGNSLVSRFDVKDNVFSAGDRAIFNAYKLNVLAYKNAKTRDERKSLKVSIDKYKAKIKGFYKDPIIKEKQKLLKLTDELNKLNYSNIFDSHISDNDNILIEEKRKILEEKITTLSEKIKEKEEEDYNIHLNAFEWRFEFPEVLDDDGCFWGFDVIIGNPPYGRYLDLSDSLKNILRDNDIYGPTADIAECFIKRVNNSLLRKDSIFSFIVPKGLSYVNSWSNIRQLFLEDYNIFHLIDTSRSFDEVLYEMMIFVISKKRPFNKNILSGFLSKTSLEIFPINRNYYSSAHFYTGFPEKYFSILIKINDNCKPLSEFVDFWYGKGGMTPLVNKKSKGIRLLTGKEIQRYSFKTEEETWYLEKGYLNKEDVRHQKKEKVVVQDIVAHILNPIPHIKITAALDVDERFCLNTVMCFSENKNKLKNKTLLAIINSKFISFYYYYFVYNQAIRTMHFMPGYADLLPIPKNIFNKQDQIINIVKKILAKKENRKNTDTSVLENEVDKIVYKLYELTPEEIEIVENSFNRKK